MSRPATGANRYEGGSASVIVVVLIAGLLAIGTALIVLGFQPGVRSHTEAVADLAALAAAQNGACHAAEQVVERNPRHGTRLLRCELDGGFAQVLVVSRAINFEATSRAGPAW